jgi:hypothetical protein
LKKKSASKKKKSTAEEEASDGDACVDVFVILEGSKLLRME